MPTPKTPNFTDAQVARIEAEPVFNAASAERVALEIGKTKRSVIAKMVRLGGYKSAARTTKSGAPVVSKADLVADIAEIVDGNLTDLDKAPKAALFALRAFARSVANEG